jgi:cell pole-organizing protein PopZ
MKDFPPSKIPAAVAAAEVARPAPPPAPPPPAPASPAPVANNNQDEIDALLAGLDETTTPKEIGSPRPNDELHELTNDMAAPAPPQASFRRVEPHDDVEFAEVSASRAAHRPPAYDPPAPSSAILSQSTVVAVETAFNTLANTVLSNQARTLEDIVKDMLRPMLKSWLDDNLPGLVERIVKAEIERISRGR